SGHRRPCGGKALIGLTPQEQGIGLEKLRRFPLFLFRAAKLEGPSAVFGSFSTAWIVHDTIKTHKLRDDDFAHGHALPFALVLSLYVRLNPGRICGGESDTSSYCMPS